MKAQLTIRDLFWLVLVICTGCGGGGVQSVHKVNGVTINVRHSGHAVSTTGKSADGVDTWTDNEMTYGLDHGHIMLNSKDYGEVKAGDEVAIAAGKVKVNGMERQPVRNR
jgi:hypothetical protein